MNLLLKKKIGELRAEKARLEKATMARCEKNDIALEEQVSNRYDSNIAIASVNLHSRQ